MYQTYDLPRQIIKAATKKSSRYNSSSTTIPQPQPPENDNGNGIYHNSHATNPTRHSSGENLYNLLWRYALVWLVAQSSSHVQSTIFSSRPQNLQCSYVPCEGPTSKGPRTAVGSARIGFRSKQKCI